MISHFVCTSALVLVCAASAATAATARTPYDGAWTVLIVTQRGTCDRSYRYGVIALPPGAPREAAEALRAAAMKLGRDRSFAEDAARIIGYVPQFETAADIDEKVRRALTVSPDVKAFVADYVKRAKQARLSDAAVLSMGEHHRTLRAMISTA